jgi:hypothetical protein
LTLINPETTGQGIQATAAVTSTNPVSGAIQFFVTNTGQSTGLLTVSNGQAATVISLPGLGVYPIYAQYSGDSLNKPSKSANVTATYTGTDSWGISGTTATLVHSVPMTITVQ